MSESVKAYGLGRSSAAPRRYPARGRPGFQSANRIRRALFVALASLTVAAISPALGQNPTVKPPEVLQGKLIVLDGDRPALRTPKRDYTLKAKISYLFHTLQDERLLNREVRLEGTLQPDGTFEVTHFFTMRDGKLYRLRYYCEICNISALEPGNCVCCQRPTQPQEIPLSEVGKDTVVVP